MEGGAPSTMNMEKYMTAGNFQSPMSKKVGRMGGVPTPLAGVTNIPSPNRWGLVLNNFSVSILRKFDL